MDTSPFLQLASGKMYWALKCIGPKTKVTNSKMVTILGVPKKG